jgi:hypothetical protein
VLWELLFQPPSGWFAFSTADASLSTPCSQTMQRLAGTWTIALWLELLKAIIGCSCDSVKEGLTSIVKKEKMIM